MENHGAKKQIYATDLTDEQWKNIAPIIPEPRHKTERGGRPRGADPREVLNAILYIKKTSCQWRMVPHDFGVKWQLIYHYFRAWRKDGTMEKVHEILRHKRAR
jgi:transposase